MHKKIFVYIFLLVCAIFFINSSNDYHFNKINFSNADFLLNPCTGPDTITITLSQPDSVRILDLKLFWSKYSNPWDSILMTNSGGNNWRGVIYVSGPANYRYYFKFRDSINRIGTVPPGTPGNYYSFVVDPDTTKPVITHTPIGNTPKQNWPVTIASTAIDNCGLDSVWVRWKINQGTGKQFRLMNTSGNIFSAAFNSTQAEVNIGDTIHYRIIAQDISVYHNKDSTVLYSFLITQSIGIEPVLEIISDNYDLYQNYPNPFNPVTRISYSIPKQGLVSLKIYDILGREVKVLVNEIKSRGSYSVDFNATGFPSGIFLYRIESGAFTETKRMSLIK